MENKYQVTWERSALRRLGWALKVFYGENDPL